MNKQIKTKASFTRIRIILEMQIFSPCSKRKQKQEKRVHMYSCSVLKSFSPVHMKALKRYDTIFTEHA